MVDARKPIPEFGREVGIPEILPTMPQQPRSDTGDNAFRMTTSPRLRRGAGTQDSQSAQGLLQLPKPGGENLPGAGGRLDPRTLNADLAHRWLQHEGGALGTPGGSAT